MNLFEFRQWLESFFPWWTPFVIPSLLLLSICVRFALGWKIK
jgi:hypothetical protein